MADRERPKLILTEEDIGEAPPRTEVVPPHEWVAPQAPPPQQPPPQQEFPTVSGVPRRAVSPGPAAGPATGVAPATLPSWLDIKTVRGRSLAAATCGIALGWVVGEITGASEWVITATTKLGADAKSGVWVALIGLVFALVYTGWDQITAGSGEGVLHVAKTVVPVGAGLGFASGFLAQLVFAEMIQSILESGDIPGRDDYRFYLARALAWGLFGMGMGAASAVVVRSREKLVNGVIGGAIGGAIGGLAFQFVAARMVEHQGTARLIGLLFVGAGIGLAIGLIETARREAWLNVVAGGMTGKEFIIYAAETKVGGDPKCEIVLIKDPAIRPYHFIIATPAGSGPQRRTLTAYQGCEVTIQGQPVAQHVLRDGDVIGVGTTAIRYAERTAQPPVASTI